MKKQADISLAFFQLAFRPFFLLGALFSIVSLVLWSAVLTGSIHIEVYGGQLWWHIHEMLFGFVCAIVVGFLLTAVQTWTGVPSIKGRYLMLLVLLWLSARVAFLLPAVLADWLIAVIDLAFLPVSAVVFATRIVKVKLWRNIVFVPLLLVMTFTNAVMHYAALSQNPTYMFTAGNSMVMIITLLMSVIGGRVFPMFTANGTQTPRVPAIDWLEKTVILSTVLVVLLSFDFFEVPVIVKICTFFVCAAAHSVRVFRWRSWVTLKTPLVWSLHLSYWCIPLGMALYGLAQFTDIVTRSQAVHTLTVGAMGTMILAMISRVSLGHTGRKLTVGKLMAVAFFAVFCAFVVRVFGVYWSADYSGTFVATVFFWAAGYGCFAILYWPVLTRPRIDQQPG